MPSPVLLDQFGGALSRAPGRPSKADTEREFTVFGGTTSPFANVTDANSLTRLRGDVDDQDIQLGWDVKEQMDRDPICAAALDTRALGATARGLEVEPAPKSSFQSEADEKKADEVAEFHRRLLGYLRETQRDLALTAFSMLRQAGKIGFSLSEIVPYNRQSGVDKGKFLPHRIKLKDRKVACFVVDKQGNVVGIAGYTGELGTYQDPYRNGKMGVTGFLPWSALESSGWKLMDRSKWVHVANTPPGDDSPTGTSHYRRAYTPWRSKRDTYPMYLCGLDNTAQPFTTVELPENSPKMYPLKPDGSQDTGAEKVDAATVIYQAIQLGRKGGTAVLPNGTKVTTHYSAQSGDPFMVAMAFYDAQITRAILLQELATSSAKHMARNAGEVHFDVLQMAFRYDRAIIEGALYRDIAVPFTKANFTEDYWHLAPRYSFGTVELNDFAAWSQAMGNLASNGLLVPSQFPHIWNVLNLPQGDMDELYQAVANDEEVMRQITQPQTDPTTGATQPSQQAEYITQETGKNSTRKIARRVNGRSGGQGF